MIRAVNDAAAACNARVVRFGEALGSVAGLENDLPGFLKSADIVVAHVPQLNPNLMYELGVAFGLAKPIIVVAPASINLPIDLRGRRTVSYEPKPDVAKLSFALKEWLQELDRQSESEHREGGLPTKPGVSPDLLSHTGAPGAGRLSQRITDFSRPRHCLRHHDTWGAF